MFSCLTVGIPCSGSVHGLPGMAVLVGRFVGAVLQGTSRTRTMITVAHLSDPHLLDLAGVTRSRLFRSKRLTGYLTLKLHRMAAHQAHIVEAMVDDINAQRVDHVAITGDITNLALEPEFAFARRIFDRLELSARDISVVPGNHDVYTRGSEREQRFVRYFAEHITSDLPVAGPTGHPSGPFPFVRLRGPLAIVGMSTAVARLPLIAAGYAGAEQLQAVAAVLMHPEVRCRTPVVLVHHPLVDLPGWLLTFTHGLAEGRRIRRLLERHVDQAVVLHGHLHDRVHREMRTSRGGTIHHIGATSASMVHRQPHRMAGYNLYRFGDDGRFLGASARMWDATTRSFVDGTILRGAPCTAS